MAKINGIALAATGTGFLFLIAGIKGYSVTQVIQDIVTGKSPKNAVTNQWSATSTSNAVTYTGSSVAASQIATDAMKYNGAGYVWGGSPASGIGHWDCSSFVSWVMGHDLHMSIPGYPNGTYTGNSHGPVTAEYLVWSGAHTIPRNQVQAGDLCCWQTHIGIAIDNTNMISALNPQLGTQVSTIEGGGPGAEILVCRRVG